MVFVSIQGQLNPGGFRGLFGGFIRTGVAVPSRIAVPSGVAHPSCIHGNTRIRILILPLRFFGWLGNGFDGLFELL